MKLRVAILLAAIIMACARPASCRVTSMEVRPLEPVRGDVITVDLRAGPGERVDVQVRFRKILQVSGGRYLLELDGIEVPDGPISFTVRAEGVANLVLAVRLGIWISVSREASGGVASITQGGVPAGRYEVQVKGDAAPGAGGVAVEVTARTTITADGEGRYTVSYDTSTIPAGEFRVDSGGLSRTLTLREAGGPPTRPPSPPVAAFTPPSGAVAGQAVALDASPSHDEDGSIVDYAWDMGDGSVIHGAAVTHTYSEPGVYSVTLTVVDDTGLTDTRVERLLVSEPPRRPPVPMVSTERACFAGQPVGFSAYASWDPDGWVTSYEWDLGDGSTASGAAVIHRYSSPGPRVVTLVVTDDDGLTGGAEISVEVLSPPAGLTEWTELTAHSGSPLALPGGCGTLRLNASYEVPILFFAYTGNPHPGGHLPSGQVGRYIDLCVGDPDLVEWPLYLEVPYDSAAVSEAQASELRLYRYLGGWLQCSETGSDPGRAIVWARLQRRELEGSPLTIGGRPPIEGAAVRSLRLSSGVVGPGEEVTAMVNIVNLLDEEKALSLTLKVDGSAVCLRTLRLGPRESRFVNLTLTLDEPGDHTVEVGGIALPLTVEPPGLPDLVIQGCFHEGAEVGRPTAITFTAANNGQAASPPFSLHLYVGGAVVGKHSIGALSPGGSAEAEFTWTPSEPGAYAVRGVADEDGLVGETDEDNNEMSVTVEVAEELTAGDHTPIIVSVVAAAVAILLLSRRGD